MMRVALVTTFFGPHRFGGDAAYVERLAEALLRRGHHVEVFYSRDAFEALRGSRESLAYEAPSGLVVHALSNPFPRLSLLWAHQTGGFDVVHYHNVSLVGGAGLLGLRIPGAIRLMTAHEHWLTCPLSVLWRFDRESCTKPSCARCTVRAGRPPQFWRSTGRLPRALGNLDALVFPSIHSRDAHRERGISHPNSHVLPYFLPDAWTQAEPPPVPAADAPFLFVGRLVREKGLETILPLFQSRSDCRLDVLGDGPYRKDLERLAAGARNIRFLGGCSADGVRAHLAHARALLVPSRFPETFGYVILEAWAHAVPVFVGRAGALPEVVGPGGGAVCDTAQDFAKAIDGSLAQPGEARRMGLSGWNRARAEFTENGHLSAWETIVRSAKPARHDA